MILPDVNVLVYAFRRDAGRHGEFKAWLERILAREPAFGLSEVVLSAVVRITTHPRIFSRPSSLAEAFAFIDALRGLPNSVIVAPGRRHWSIFTELCRSADARGNLVADAYFAALAIESGCEWITADRDYARFPGLKWRHPLS